MAGRILNLQLAELHNAGVTVNSGGAAAPATLPSLRRDQQGQPHQQRAPASPPGGAPRAPPAPVPPAPAPPIPSAPTAAAAAAASQHGVPRSVKGDALAAAGAAKRYKFFNPMIKNAFRAALVEGRRVVAVLAPPPGAGAGASAGAKQQHGKQRGKKRAASAVAEQQQQQQQQAPLPQGSSSAVSPADFFLVVPHHRPAALPLAQLLAERITAWQQQHGSIVREYHGKGATAATKLTMQHFSSLALGATFGAQLAEEAYAHVYRPAYAALVCDVPAWAAAHAAAAAAASSSRQQRQARTSVDDAEADARDVAREREAGGAPAAAAVAQPRPSRKQEERRAHFAATVQRADDWGVVAGEFYGKHGRACDEEQRRRQLTVSAQERVKSKAQQGIKRLDDQQRRQQDTKARQGVRLNRLKPPKLLVMPRPSFGVQHVRCSRSTLVAVSVARIGARPVSC